MNYATFAALNSYGSVDAALAANTSDGDAWLLNETLIYQDGTMGNPAPSGAAIKKSSQTQKAATISTGVQRNKGNDNVKTTSFGTAPNGDTRSFTYSTKVGGSLQSSPGGGTFVNRETVQNTKTPAIRHKVSWYVTDSSQSEGYRRVFGLLEDPTTSALGRDDDAQTRK